MAVSKKLRFEVFRRDNFACRYCGRTAASGALLEPDHVVPRARGGKDIATNLVTACDNCNSGKSDTPLQAPSIADVPQDLFRAACAERGVDGVELPRGAHPYADAVDYILADIGGEDTEAAFLAEVRECLAQDAAEEGYTGPITEMTVRGRAATRFFDEVWGRMRGATHALERIIGTCDPDFFWAHAVDEVEAAQANGDWNAFSAGIAALGGRYAQRLDQELLDTLPHGARVEWFAYAEWRYGSQAESRITLSPEMRVSKAAKYIREYRRIGRSVLGAVPGMCSMWGQHIPRCVKPARYVVWLEQCEGCAEGQEHEEGHPVCTGHADELRTGYASPTGVTYTVRKSVPLASDGEVESEGAQ